MSLEQISRRARAGVSISSAKEVPCEQNSRSVAYSLACKTGITIDKELRLHLDVEAKHFDGKVMCIFMDSTQSG